MENKYVGKTCPFCKTVFKEDDAIVVCSVCDMPHHLACWQENNGCTTFGCTGVIKDFIGTPEKTPDIDPITRHSDTIQPNNDEEIKGLAPSVEPVKKQDRFETLFKSDKRTIQKDSPVIVENITLLIDHSTEKLMARCSFKCLTDKPVIAMMLDVLCTDIWGNVLKSVEGVQLLDLKTKKDASFGQDTPIEIPEKATRSIDVRIKKVLFDDRTSVECGDFICVLDEPQTLLDYFGNPNVAEQYSRETTKKAKYVVRDYSEYWQCTCGAINRQAESSCSACKSEKSKLISILSDPAIAERAATYTQLMQQKAEQEKKETEERIRLAEEQVKREQEAKEVEIKKAEKKAKKKKRRKKAFIAILISLLVLAALGAVGYFFGYPMYRYYQATEMLENGQYDKAYTEFKDLHGFKDSNEMMDECKYQYARKLMNNSNYDSALRILKQLDGYSDSDDLILECRYQIACLFLKAGSYTSAISQFEDISYYKNSNDKINEAMYGYVLAHKNNYDRTTYSYLQTLKSKGYKDSSSIYSSLYSWKVTVVGWNSSDTTTDTKGYSSISKYNAVICHLELSGGAPGASINIRVTSTLPNGKTTDYTFDSPWKDGYSGWYGWSDGIYSYPKYGTTGTLTVKFYDDSYNLIGQGSIKITD